MSKKTIKVQVTEAAELLKKMTTHTELRTWAIGNGMDNRSAFPKFKTALLEIGIDYDQVKRGIVPNTPAPAPVELSPLEKLAKEIGGNLWIKADKRRIYVSGGNNYHYSGKWWVELDDDGDFEVKCWLDEGYSNKNAQEYIAKHTRSISDDVTAAMSELNITALDLARFENEEAKSLRLAAEATKKSEAESNKAKIAIAQGAADLNDCKLATNGAELAPETKIQLARHIASAPIAIRHNEHFNMRLNGVPCTADLTGAMDADYHGVKIESTYWDEDREAERHVETKGMAFVNDGKLLAWHYGNAYSREALEMMPADTKVYETAPSGHSLCFYHTDFTRA